MLQSFFVVFLFYTYEPSLSTGDFVLELYENHDKYYKC